MNPTRTSTTIMTDLNGHRFVTYAGMSRILGEHGFTPDQGTAPTAEADDWDPATSFDSEMGIRHQYKLADVYAWLGY